MTEKHSTNFWTAVIVAIGVGAVTWITDQAIAEYETAAEAATILGIVITPLAGIAAAAFGIKLTVDAKNETKDAATKTQQVATRSQEIATDVAALRQSIAPGESIESNQASVVHQLQNIENRLRGIGTP